MCGFERCTAEPADVLGLCDAHRDRSHLVLVKGLVLDIPCEECGRDAPPLRGLCEACARVVPRRCSGCSDPIGSRNQSGLCIDCFREVSRVGVARTGQVSTCVECREDHPVHARGMCHRCYKRAWHRAQKERVA